MKSKQTQEMEKKGTSDKERYIIRGKKKPKNNLMISLEFRLTFRRQTFWAVYFSILSVNHWDT